MVPFFSSAVLHVAFAWLGVFGAWYAKFAPAYLKPRPDGRPG